MSEHGGPRGSGRGGNSGGSAGGGRGPGSGAGAAAVGHRRSRRNPIGLIVAAVLLVALFGTTIARFMTDVWWYDSVGYRSVFNTVIGTQWLLGIVGGAVMALAIAASMVTAYRTRPLLVHTPSADAMLRYRAVFESLRRPATIAIPLVLGLFAGLTTQSAWDTFLLWRNAQPFGRTDPQFGLDLGFFVFTLPWLQEVLGYLAGVLILSFIASALTQYVYGGLVLPSSGRRSTQASRVQLAVICALLLLVRAGTYWLDRYALTTKSALFTGIQYTDAFAVLPTKDILTVASVLCALFFLSVIVTRSWRLPLIGLVALLVVAVVVGGIVPAAVQAIKVKPSEKSLEVPFLRNNITATRDAYGLSAVQVDRYDTTATASPVQLAKDAQTVPGIRIVDPNVVAETFQQVQGSKGYYKFPDSLDVDRYPVDGVLTDGIVGVREISLDGVPADKRNWLNDHTVYTHGYGFVAAYGNRVDSEGKPVFFEQPFPQINKLGPYEPRIYFGERSPNYSVVGGATGSSQREFDYNDDSAAGQANTTYTGKGGVAIGSFGRKLAYAISYRESNFLLSDAVNADSRILDHRTPLDRVKRVAPWLTLDGDPYPAVVDGRVLWIVDGYTTTDNYPNSAHTSMDAATTDSITASKSSVTTAKGGQINYIRNSVKATVDAYDGTVSLYQWDQSDPIVKAWMSALPGTVKPITDISSQLMAHLHYPEDLFKVQRDQLARYHVTDADSFYGGQDFWQVPADPTAKDSTKVDQPAYYLTLAMPGQSDPALSITSTFIPTGSRNVLTGFLSAQSYAGTTAGSPSPDFGTLRLLDIRTPDVPGPGQVQNEIDGSNVTSASFSGQSLSGYLNLQKQGATLTFGNLLTLPMGGGLLYVEPVYVKSATGTSFPQFRVVIAKFGNKLAWDRDLAGALKALFNGDTGAPSPPATPSGPTSPSTPTSPGTPSSPTSPGGTGSAALQQALADAQQAMADADAALKQGDWAKYGEAQQRLHDAIARAVAAGAASGSISSPTNSPAPTTAAATTAAATTPPSNG